MKYTYLFKSKRITEHNVYQRLEAKNDEQAKCIYSTNLPIVLEEFVKSEIVKSDIYRKIKHDSSQQSKR